MLRNFRKKSALIFAGLLAAVSFTGCFGGGAGDGDPEFDPSELQAQIQDLERQVASLREQTVTNLEYRNKNDVIFGRENPAVSEAASIKDELMKNLPETITIKGVEYSTRLTSLTLNNLGLTDADVADLKYMIFLEELHIYQNRITDLTPLKGLTSLRTLSLFNNEVSDLTPLAGLIQLEALYLRSNKLTDISPIDGLVHLRILDISRNEVTDISPLSDMTEMTLLKINDNKITSIAGLGEMRKMDRLHLQNNRVSDLSPVSNMTDVTEIYFEGNEVANVEPLRALTDLAYIKAGRNPLTDLRPLGSLHQLKKLYIEGLSVDGETMDYLGEELTRCMIIK